MDGRGIKDWIQTYTGKKFFPLDPRLEDICIEDIARALSMQCRYAGHVARFYSVAEHSVRVSRIIEERTGDLNKALWGLLHDATEAYLCDIPRPLKRQTVFAAYRDAERLLMTVIAERFGLVGNEPEEVIALDTEILGTEARELKSPIHPDWAKTTATGELPPSLGFGNALGWDPFFAERSFLGRFDDLVYRTAKKEAANG